jgi:ankyrin repeat protein
MTKEWLEATTFGEDPPPSPFLVCVQLVQPCGPLKFVLDQHLANHRVAKRLTVVLSSQQHRHWNATGKSKETLLWMAAEMGDARAAANLVAAGADILSQNLGNQTVLHRCAMRAHESIWCLATLLRLGADSTIVCPLPSAQSGTCKSSASYGCRKFCSAYISCPR